MKDNEEMLMKSIKRKEQKKKQSKKKWEERVQAEEKRKAEEEGKEARQIGQERQIHLKVKTTYDYPHSFNMVYRPCKDMMKSVSASRCTTMLREFNDSLG